MTPTLDDDPEWLRVMYWGGYGTGKTTDAASAARIGGVQFIRADRGIKKRPLANLGVPTDRIFPVDELQPDRLARMGEGWNEDDGIVAIVLDTATEYVAKRIGLQVDAAWKRYVTQCKRKHSAVDHDMRYTAGDTRDHYAAVSQEVRMLMRSWTGLSKHLILTGQTRRDVDDKNSTVMFGPAVNPALQGDLVGYMDVVFRTESPGFYPDGRQIYLGHPKTGGKYMVKDNLGTMPRILVSPTFDRVLAYNRGELDYKTDPLQLEYKEWLKNKEKEDEL